MLGGLKTIVYFVVNLIPRFTKFTCRLFCYSNLFLLCHIAIFGFISLMLTLHIWTYNPDQSIQYPLHFQYGENVHELEIVVRVRQMWFIRQVQAYKKSRVHLRQMSVDFDVLGDEDRTLQMDFELLNAKNQTIYKATRAFMNDREIRSFMGKGIDTFRKFLFYPYFRKTVYRPKKSVHMPFIVESDLESMYEINRKISNAQWIIVSIKAIPKSPAELPTILKTYDAKLSILGELNGFGYVLYYHWFIVWVFAMISSFVFTSTCLSSCCCIIIMLYWKKRPRISHRVESYIVEDHNISDDDDSENIESDTESMQSERTAVFDSTPNRRDNHANPLDDTPIHRRRPIRREERMD